MSVPQNVIEAKETHKEALLDKANVVGVGVGYKVVGGEPTGELSVAVLVREKVPTAQLDPAARVPPQVDGVKTDVVQVGEIRSLQTRTERWRPAPPGVSIGHYQITAGTFGAVVRDRSSGARLILSNNHVIANSNNATAGDPILQPGPIDGGSPSNDVIARLERFCPIQFTSSSPGECNIAGGVAGLANFVARLLGSQHRLESVQVHPQATNRVDAAVARPLQDAAIVDEILEIGPIQGTRPATLLMPVRKSGRSTGLTTGQITVIDATINVSYDNRTAQFEGQLVSGPMSAPGDSGSLLVAGDSLQAVGLLFSGSDQTTVYTPIQDVLDCLDVII